MNFFYRFLLICCLTSPLKALEVDATFAWDKSVNLGFFVSGHLNKIMVNIGDKVSKGQLLASLNPAPFLAKKQQANSALSAIDIRYKEAKAELKRINELHSRNLISEHDKQLSHIETSKVLADYQQQQQALILATLNVDYSKLHAPFNGTIVNVSGQKGETIVSTMNVKTIIKIVNTKYMQAHALLPFADISTLKKAQAVQVLVGDKWIKGKIAWLGLEPSQVQNEVPLYTLAVRFQQKHSTQTLRLGAKTKIKVNESL